MIVLTRHFKDPSEILVSASALASALQLPEFRNVFNFCVTLNHNSKILQTIFFMLKRKNNLKESLRDRHWALIIYVIIYRKIHFLLKIISYFILLATHVRYALLCRVSFRQVEDQRRAKLFFFHIYFLETLRVWGLSYLSSHLRWFIVTSNVVINEIINYNVIINDNGYHTIIDNFIDNHIWNEFQHVHWFRVNKTFLMKILSDEK